MSKIKIAELFYSIQGEGRYMGVPSIFLRTFGCNFKCAGFGMPKGELSEEYLKIDPTQYSKYEELPLVSTGCDSYASWDPAFKHLSPMLTVDAITDRIT
jgi:organic radical activating enzyme